MTFDPKPEDVAAVNVPTLTDINLQQLQYVDFVALGGLLTDESGEFRTMTTREFADQVGVSRNTLYTWQKTIPDFWEKVRIRRLEITKRTRATKVYNGLFLKAARGDPAAVKLWSEIFDNYQPPAQKHEVSIGGLADLAKIAEQKKIIEGEAVDGDQPTASA